MTQAGSLDIQIGEVERTRYRCSLPLLIFGTGWNEVPKQSSTRSAIGKRRNGSRTHKVNEVEESLKRTLLCSEIPADFSGPARELVLASWPAIVEGLIKKARAGGYQQTKLLLDLSSLTNADSSHWNDQRKEQLCDALLEGLGLSSDQTIHNADEMNDLAN